MSSEPEPIVTRSLTIAELMDGNGDRYLSFDHEGGLEDWDALGLLSAATAWYQAALLDQWDTEPADGED